MYLTRVIKLEVKKLLKAWELLPSFHLKRLKHHLPSYREKVLSSCIFRVSRLADVEKKRGVSVRGVEGP